MWVELRGDVSMIGPDGLVSGMAGEVIEVTSRTGVHLINVYGAKEAKPPIPAGAAEHLNAADKQAIEQAVADAVQVLVELGDPASFNKNGVPKIGAVRGLLPKGTEVTTADVQRAFEALTNDNGD